MAYRLAAEDKYQAEDISRRAKRGRIKNQDRERAAKNISVFHFENGTHGTNGTL
jgi:hypothetical protein